jgi:hypothetical protein
VSTAKKRKAPAAIKPGRKPFAPSGEAMRMRHVRMLDAEWDKCLASTDGASAWIRHLVRDAPWPQ